MSPIKGLSETRRMPRLGKIHLGVKVPNSSGSGEHPKAVDYFVLTEELKAVFGEQPKELPIMFPVEDLGQIAQQWYKCYSSSRGLVCKGDGEKSWRLVDLATGDFANRDSKETATRECKCDGPKCPKYQSKDCKEVMNLQFFIPSYPGIGVWQLDTGSINSIIQINSAVDLIQRVCGRVAMIPLKLTIEPKEVQADGKKKVVQVLNIRTGVTLAEVQKCAQLPVSQALLPPPDEEEKPDLLYPDVEEPETAPKVTVVEVKPPAPAPTAAAKPEAPKAEAKPKAARKYGDSTFEPAEGGLKTLGDFYQASLKRFGLNKTDTLKKLGYANDAQLADLWDEWERLKGMEG